MINSNGELQDMATAKLSMENRGYKYGDALFETLKVVNGHILFFEDHYFRFMASMRILRMEIPMEFTMEFLQEEILKTIEANNLSNHTSRVRITVDRGEGGRYAPISNTINYNIIVEKIENHFYSSQLENSNSVELYKDYFVAPGLLSTLKTTNRTINILGSIYAEENGFDNGLLLNTNKHVIEALNGNLFLVKNNCIKTPQIEDGCLKGIMRKQIIEIVSKLEDYDIEEASISPFELQKADELFITNVITGIQPITNFRKKTYSSTVSELLTEKLNIKIRLLS
ncbi:aminotransferase class IV [Flavobacteriales bacterium 34_180_T64]|nr:aminotransferase class IV [Flavobacteriales bacterium 34_180_T64]